MSYEYCGEGIRVHKVARCSYCSECSEHAVVIGSSVAGMLAARVLAEYFERVTIVERDLLAENAEPRKGVPQAHHLHILLQRGRTSLEYFFPGLGDELIGAGAPTIDIANDIVSLAPAGWEVRFPSELNLLSPSRRLLDDHIRRRLTAFPRISFLPSKKVEGLISDKAGAGVAGVSVSTQDSEADGGSEPLCADLVADASGRGSRLPRWLENLGYGATPQSMVDAHIGYASRIYEVPGNFDADWRGMRILDALPEHVRGGALLPIENGRWLVTLHGGDRDYPPTDDERFVEFARTLRSPLLYEALKDAEPLTPIYGHRGTRNRLNHFEKLSRWPEGLVALGDSVCAFNPIYGQGMTNAALGAETLERFLHRRSGRGTGKRRYPTARFQASLARVNKTSWSLASGEDHSYESTESSEGAGPNVATRLMGPYFRKVVRLAAHDPDTRRVLLRTVNMLEEPRALLRPRILGRVLTSGVRHRASDL